MCSRTPGNTGSHVRDDSCLQALTPGSARLTPDPGVKGEIEPDRVEVVLKHFNGFCTGGTHEEKSLTVQLQLQ